MCVSFEDENLDPRSGQIPQNYARSSNYPDKNISYLVSVEALEFLVGGSIIDNFEILELLF
jgi:hypothetical protein